jgi:hypothetical protein
MPPWLPADEGAQLLAVRRLDPNEMRVIHEWASGGRARAAQRTAAAPSVALSIGNSFATCPDVAPSARRTHLRLDQDQPVRVGQGQVLLHHSAEAEVASIQVAEYPHYFVSEVHQVDRRGLPGDLQIQAEVVVAQLVRHACDPSPRDVRVPASGRIRQILHCLADDLQATKDRVLSELVRLDCSSVIGPM